MQYVVPVKICPPPPPEHSYLTEVGSQGLLLSTRQGSTTLVSLFSRTQFSSGMSELHRLPSATHYSNKGVGAFGVGACARCRLTKGWRRKRVQVESHICQGTIVAGWILVIWGHMAYEDTCHMRRSMHVEQ